MKVEPSSLVLDWLNNQLTTDLFLTSVTIGEIQFGLRVLPDGKRWKSLHKRFDQFGTRAFDQRILNYDTNLNLTKRSISET